MSGNTSARRAANASVSSRVNMTTEPSADLLHERPDISQRKTKKGAAAPAKPATATQTVDSAPKKRATDVEPLPQSLKSIHEHVRATFKDRDLLDNLPPNDDYTFDEAGFSDPENHHMDMLFLGEQGGMQTWASLRTKSKGEAVLFFNYHTATDAMIPTKNFATLRLMYPFKVFQDYGSMGKDMLVTLIRYVYRETRRLDRDFGGAMRNKLVGALRQIENNYTERWGGSLNVPNIQIPSVMPSARNVPVVAPNSAPMATDATIEPNVSVPHHSNAGNKRLHDVEESVEVLDEEAKKFEEYQALQEKRLKGQSKRAKTNAKIESLRQAVASSAQEDEELSARQQEILQGKDASWVSEQQLKYDARKNGC